MRIEKLLTWITPLMLGALMGFYEILHGLFYVVYGTPDQKRTIRYRGRFNLPLLSRTSIHQDTSFWQSIRNAVHMKTLFGIMIITLIATESPRQVLLFYTNSGLEKQKAQMAIMDAYQKEMIERDINVQSFPSSGKNLSAWKKWDIDTASSFTFILIGRDGGEKLRSSEVVSAEKLFGLIDAMPMRKDEIKRSRNNKPK